MIYIAIAGMSVREKCLHSQCVCVCVTGFLVQHSIVHWFKYFNTYTKIFRSVTIFFRTFAKLFWSISENFGPSCPHRVDKKTRPGFLKIQMQTNMYLKFTSANTDGMVSWRVFCLL